MHATRHEITDTSPSLARHGSSLPNTSELGDARSGSAVDIGWVSAAMRTTTVKEDQESPQKVPECLHNTSIMSTEGQTCTGQHGNCEDDLVVARNRCQFQPILKSMQSVTSLGFSPDPHRTAEPRYVASILSMLPALQAVTLPVFKDSAATTHITQRTRACSSMRTELHSLDNLTAEISSQGQGFGCQGVGSDGISSQGISAMHATHAPEHASRSLPLDESLCTSRSGHRYEPLRSNSLEETLCEPDTAWRSTFTEDVEALGLCLRSLRSLDSLVVQLYGSDAYVFSLVKVLFDVDSADCDTAESPGLRTCTLTRLEFVPAAENYYSPWGDDSQRLRHSTSCDVLCAVARLSTLQHLAVQVLPIDRSDPHVVSDVPKYLGQLSGLTALTKLDISYDTTEGMFSLIFHAPSSQSVFAFLETLATTLEPLRSLRVLHFVCPSGQLRPAEYDVHLMGPVNTARLDKFRQFALGLEDVLVRGKDGDVVYPFARILEGVPAIRTVQLVDEVEEYAGCQLRSREIAFELRNLQFLTELRLHLSSKLPTECAVALAESLCFLQHLKRLYIEQV